MQATLPTYFDQGDSKVDWSQNFPDGTHGGQCGDFLFHAFGIPRPGTPNSEKLKHIDNTVGTDAHPVHVGDVIVQDTHSKTGHVAIINSITRDADGKVWYGLTESNWNNDEKITNDRKIAVTDPSIEGYIPNPVPHQDEKPFFSYQGNAESLGLGVPMESGQVDFYSNLNQKLHQFDSLDQLDQFVAQAKPLIDNKNYDAASSLISSSAPQEQPMFQQSQQQSQPQSSLPTGWTIGPDGHPQKSTTPTPSIIQPIPQPMPAVEPASQTVTSPDQNSSLPAGWRLNPTTNLLEKIP